jgi:hypothetical protein
MQFEHGLAGERVRGREVKRQTFVQRAAVGAAEARETGVTGSGQAAEQGAGNLRRVRSGDAHDTDTADARRRGDSGDGVGGR